MVSNATCSIESCDRPVYGHGWCKPHWKRWWRHGDPDAATPLRAPGRKLCSVEDCNKLVKGHGLCHTHLARQRRNGAPVLQPAFDEKIAYEAKVDRSGGPDACHPWTGKLDNRGYARGTRDGKTNVLMQAWAYRTFVGPLGPNELVRHTCDNPPCQNPRHWLSGTHQDNSDDKVSRQRQARGETSGVAVLTESDVHEIRKRAANGEVQRQIAADYGVHSVTVSQIHLRKTWAWLPDLTQVDVALAAGP